MWIVIYVFYRGEASVIKVCQGEFEGLYRGTGTMLRCVTCRIIYKVFCFLCMYAIL